MIDSFRGKYSFLSNFYESKFGFIYEDNPYVAKTVEHAYQALKMKSKTHFHAVLSSISPAGAKAKGQKFEMREDWDAVNENWFKTWPLMWAFYGQTGARTYKHALYWLGIFDNPRYLNPSRVPKAEALKNTRKILLDMGMKLVR